ncbi:MULTISPECIES: TetR/AcrR family transcriptional regulator [Pantoea]|uniref:TetR family transcriptional regulator n=1 Tax=Pantoea cypripedii TaxID=55209 RepID=A0A1X1ELA0_PANCY|nr:MULTISPECIES: TetR/AcrR family transcriptional regulator [Pantoea]MBP2200104.1 TetR/AcrR family transcriptional repressor of nem operon [Pantoea cypripedii]ORM89707.1 TetR family transcriptional regulator [Pantoea cypripedii]
MRQHAGRPREFDPQDFLNSALDCFWQQGYRATSMADLMKASGLASASIYKLYADKRSIFLAALQQYMDAGLVRGKQRDDELTPVDALRETLEFVALVSSGPEGEKGCFTIAAACELLPGDADVRARVEYKFRGIVARLTSILQKGQQQGVFRNDESAAVMAECIFMMLEGMRVYGKIKPDITMLRKTNDFIIKSVQG